MVLSQSSGDNGFDGGGGGVGGAEKGRGEGGQGSGAAGPGLAGCLLERASLELDSLIHHAPAGRDQPQPAMREAGRMSMKHV